VTNVRPGEELILQVFVQDLRPTGKGIFAAYLDVEYDGTRVVPNGSLVHGPSYSNATSGDISQPGQIDEAGGTDGVRPLGLSEFLLLQVTLRATESGWVTFATNPADLSPLYDVLVFASDRAVDPELIEFGSITVRVADFTNPQLPADVDGDQVVSPIDALLVINDLNASGPRVLSSNMPLDAIPQYAVDVNGDGFLSPVDALQVINLLNEVRPQSVATVDRPDATPAPLPAEFLHLRDSSEEAQNDRNESLDKSQPTDFPTPVTDNSRPLDIVAIDSLFASRDESGRPEFFSDDIFSDDPLAKVN
jgi:hypothetical protein